VRKKHILADNEYQVYLVLGGHKNDEFGILRDAEHLFPDASLTSEVRALLAPKFELDL
jgi:hypothetical protein